MAQNKMNINILLQNFFSKNPDIKEARNKGLVNRRALAKYIIKNENLSYNEFEALVTALRRFETNKPEDFLNLVKDVKISTKDNIAIVYLEKSEESLKNISKILTIINFNKNETLKIVQGSLSLKLFIDDFNLKKVESIFNSKDIIKIYMNISEINLIFPEKATKTKGQIAYITSQLAINDVNIIELLTGKPELIIYVEENDLLKAYETIKRLR